MGREDVLGVFEGRGNGVCYLIGCVGVGDGRIYGNFYCFYLSEVSGWRFYFLKWEF